MLWPDDTTLASRPWWTWPAWSDGPTLGRVVVPVRPALRSALLLGYRVDAIALGIGRATGQTALRKRGSGALVVDLL